MANNILMIAYHYPPVAGSSGVHRTLKFTEYLPEFNWNPIVLTVNSRAYEHTSSGQLHQIPKSVLVKRAFALDTARHLAVRGSYFTYMALPDRWVSWWFSGVVSALRLIKQNRVKVIWSTYPISTAHLIALTVHKITGLPWIADFRDSMTEETYPADKLQRKVFRWIERHTVKNCTYAVFTTSGTKRMYAQRYPDIDDEKWVELSNGFDEESFQQAMIKINKRNINNNKKMILLHSGILYPSERDPTEFFSAISEIRKKDNLILCDVEIRLRATGHDDYIQTLINQYDIQDIVKLLPSLPYLDALEEMLLVDGLLLLQASNCNHQIPAKVYEYLRAYKPILALTDLTGDTAQLLKNAGVGIVTQLNNKDAIKNDFTKFVSAINNGSISILNEEQVNCYSRRGKTTELVKLLNTINF